MKKEEFEILQVIVEELSNAGVPVLVMDINFFQVYKSKSPAASG
jgi:hypothetical protein